MNVSKLIPKPEKKIEFIYKNINLVPRKMGCYVLTNFNNEIIYLGLTDNLSRRLKEHLENEEKNKLTAIGKIYWCYYIFIETEKDIYRTERGWMNIYELEHGDLPILNKIHSPMR